MDIPAKRRAAWLAVAACLLAAQAPAQTAPAPTPLPALAAAETPAVTVIGRDGDILVVRTTDGGYRCATAADLGLSAEQLAQASTNTDVVAIHRTHEICARLRQTPNDAVLLSELGKAAVGQANAGAFCHYVSIYCAGCLAAGDVKRAGTALQAVRGRDPQYFCLASFASLVTTCATCAGSGHDKTDAAQPCAACGGSGKQAVKWKSSRVFQEMLHDGDMSLAVLQAELDRTEPPKSAPVQQGGKVRGDPAAGGAPTPEMNVYQILNAIRTDPLVGGKTVIVSAKVLQVISVQKDTILVLEGNLRCRLKQALSDKQQKKIVSTQVKLLGVIVPRAEILTMSSPHMIDCVLH